MASGSEGRIRFCPWRELPREVLQAGFRQGAKGTHSSRTIMLDDLSSVMSATTPATPRREYIDAITDGNCLGKSTAATRRLSSQRLSELYALDPEVPIFRIFRRLW